MAEELPVARRWAVGALLTMTFATGLVDALSYLRLGRVFVANMTGNVVFLGFSVAQKYGLPVVAPIVSMASFVLGSLIGGQLSRVLGGSPRRWIAGAFAGQAAVLAGTAVLIGTGVLDTRHGHALVLIAILGTCCGLQNATVRLMAPRDLTTTVLTQTVTGLAAESALGAGTGAKPHRRLGSVLAMLGGAVVGGLLLEVTVAGLVGIVAVLVAGTAGVFALAPPPEA
ncbi:YoaK family protein [Streptomyces sp. NPDC088725]|uniref:YoaK family protein n=1 Tax=Streptomyces sp. NPDC088725 TaxID=3365873 RepID=UPI00382FCBB8